MKVLVAASHFRLTSKYSMPMIDGWIESPRLPLYPLLRTNLIQNYLLLLRIVLPMITMVIHPKHFLMNLIRVAVAFPARKCINPIHVNLPSRFRLDSKGFLPSKGVFVAIEWMKGHFVAIKLDADTLHEWSTFHKFRTNWLKCNNVLKVICSSIEAWLNLFAQTRFNYLWSFIRRKVCVQFLLSVFFLNGISIASVRLNLLNSYPYCRTFATKRKCRSDKRSLPLLQLLTFHQSALHLSNVRC